MKTISRVLVVLWCAASLSAGLCAQQGPPPWAGQGRSAAGRGDDELAALERFLAMSDADLAATQDAIARVRTMSADERAALLAQIRAFRHLPPDQRDEIRAGWGWQNEQDRDDWRTMMHRKTPEERAAVQKELQALTPDQRTKRKLELLRAWRETGAANPRG